MATYQPMFKAISFISSGYTWSLFFFNLDG
jgi:hypothetical protein